MCIRDSKHTTFVFGDLSDNRGSARIIICPDSENRDELIQASGDGKGNKIISEVAELHSKDLFYGDDNIANAYRAWQKGNKTISMNPKRQFGEPMVDGTGYSAQALYHAYLTEGGIDAAAKEYGVDPGDIEVALSYFDHLQGPQKLSESKKTPF